MAFSYAQTDGDNAYVASEMDNYSLAATGRHVDTIAMDGKDTYVEYAIGAQYNVNKNTFVYADIERTAGAEVDEDWRANVGVRYSF